MGFWDRFKPTNKEPEPVQSDADPSQPKKADFGDALVRQMQRGANPDMRMPLAPRAYSEAELASYEQTKREQLRARIHERLTDHAEGLESSKRDLSKWSLISDQDLRQHIQGITFSGAIPSIEEFRSQKVQHVAESMRNSERVVLALNLVAEALHATGNDPQAAVLELDKKVAEIVDALQECQRLGKPENVQQALWSKHARLRKAGEILRNEYKAIWSTP